ncbi:MAG TPA: glycoside hydrolase family 1 protein [bacterium]|nr:glycoside hydrolase family 1 protein [bacterium]
MKNKFPPDFLFGSATSAHQIEGHLNNDWSRWEKTPGKISDGSTSAVSADSWNRWRDDIKILKNSGQNAYRFSIEWSRIEPKAGFFDKKSIAHYRDMIDELLKNDITPMVTLWHFTSPLWLDDIGGVLNRKFPTYFSRFAGRMAKEFGDKIELWSVLNEPTVYLNAGFIQGNWYPGKKRQYFSAVKAFFRFVAAHKQAYTSMKSANSRIKVGIAHNMSAYFPVKDRWRDRFMTKFTKWFTNEYFLNQIKGELDFIGINHYLTHHIQCKKPIIFDEIGKEQDYWWPVRPYGIREVIKDAGRYHLPIYITENGLGDHGEADKLRGKYIEEIFEQLRLTLKDGADLRGYFFWSLIDNFEWASGYSMKFGLHTIDRKPKKSAEVYKKNIENCRFKQSLL